MRYLLLCLVWFCSLEASPPSLQTGAPAAFAGSLQAEGLNWYTMTSSGVLCDKAGPYCLSGGISQSPVSPTVVLDTGGFCIISGFWSSECDVRFNPERSVVLTASLMPGVFKLYRNSPNPFRGATRIAYDLPVRSKVLLSIYDVDGRQVARLADGWQEAGRYNLKWDGRDKRGRACPTGVYFCSLKTEEDAAVRKMLIAE
jgi:hypothetical protein